jgi:hypothetical protein
VALLIGFAVSFAHIAFRLDGVPSASRLKPRSAAGPRSPSASTDQRFCAISHICTIYASVALAGCLVLPQPPALVVAGVPRG